MAGRGGGETACHSLARWECALPIYKNGDATDPASFRLIVVTPTRHRPYASMMTEAVTWWFTTGIGRQLVKMHQFGFRAGCIQSRPTGV